MKKRIEHTDIIVSKHIGHHAISYCWMVTDYILVLQEYGELNVDKADYENARIGQQYTWYTKR